MLFIRNCLSLQRWTTFMIRSVMRFFCNGLWTNEQLFCSHS
jgi:hypothetical protein